MGTADVEQTRASYEALCGWCGSVVGYSAVKYSRGVCETCYPHVIPAPDITIRHVEQIPLGSLQLNDQGRVLDHEDSLHRSVVGRNPFTKVVPFTLVIGFQERYQNFLASGEAGRVFNLIFRVGLKEIQVRVFFGRICAELAMARIKLKV